MVDIPAIPVLALTGVVLLSIYKFFIEPLFFSPLSKIPNAHWSAPLSNFWIYWIRYTERENVAVHAAHMKHGEVVRLAPSELSTSSIDGGVRTIYTGGFEKAEWYSVFENYGAENMFSSWFSKPHSMRKRMISHVYSKSYIQNSKAVDSQAKIIVNSRLLPTLSSFESAGTTVDVMEFYEGAMMDFTTAYQFGLRLSSNFIQDGIERRRWLTTYQNRSKAGFFPQELPGIMNICHRLGYRIRPALFDSMCSELENWCAVKCAAATEAIVSGERIENVEDEPEVVRALYTGIQKEIKTKGQDSILASTVLAKPELSLASEMFDHLAAGHETSGITLTYMTHYLSLDPSLQASLRAELLALDPPMTWPPSSEFIASSSQVDKLPLLHAIIMETLRIRGPIPGGQPRITPPNTTLGSYGGIPAGTRVSAQGYTLHRNEDAFPDAEKFVPCRWFDKENKLKDRYFWAFSSGGRMCVGNNLAMHQMKMTAAAIYTNFTTHIVDDEGIEQLDGYTVGPRANQLLIRFEKA